MNLAGGDDEVIGVTDELQPARKMSVVIERIIFRNFIALLPSILAAVAFLLAVIIAAGRFSN